MSQLIWVMERTSGRIAETGVRRQKTSDNASIKMVQVRSHFPGQTLDIERGIQFLVGEIGNKYGWSNILNSDLKFLNLPYRVSRIDRYDCSSLVTCYLKKIGIDMGDLGEEPDSVSLNDLARALGLI